MGYCFSDEVYVEQSAIIKGALGLELARDTGTHNLFLHILRCMDWRHYLRYILFQSI